MSRLVYGKRPVGETLRHQAQHVKELYLEEGREKTLSTLVEAAEAAGVAIQWVERRKLDRQCGSPRHQGAAAVVADFDYTSVKDFLARRSESPRVVLALDGITDPQNLGACLRAAGSFGVNLVVIPKHHGCPVTAAVVKVSAGATETVPIARESNLGQSLDVLKQAGFWVYGLDADVGQPLGKADLSGEAVLVLGREGEGLHRLIKEKCDLLLHIPAAGQVASLNVSQACAIGLYEVFASRAQRKAQE